MADQSRDTPIASVESPADSGISSGAKTVSSDGADRDRNISDLDQSFHARRRRLEKEDNRIDVVRATTNSLLFVTPDSPPPGLTDSEVAHEAEKLRLLKFRADLREHLAANHEHEHINKVKHHRLTSTIKARNIHNQWGLLDQGLLEVLADDMDRYAELRQKHYPAINFIPIPNDLTLLAPVFELILERQPVSGANIAVLSTALNVTSQLPYPETQVVCQYLFDTGSSFPKKD